RHSGDLATAVAQRSGEGDGVVDRRGARVIVEVDVDVLVVRVGLDDPVDPLGQLGFGVERPWVVLAFVEAQVAPVGGPPQRRDRAMAVGPAQRGVVPLEASAYAVV